MLLRWPHNTCTSRVGNRVVDHFWERFREKCANAVTDHTMVKLRIFCPHFCHRRYGSSSS